MEKIYKDVEFMEYPKEKRIYNSLVETIPIELYKQVKGERDVAIEQLKALNIELFEKPYLKAIPIEWIEKFIDNDILSETVKILLNAWYWEKENEISVMPVSDNSTIPLDYLGERK